MKIKAKIYSMAVLKNKRAVAFQLHDDKLLDELSKLAENGDLWLTVQREGKSKNINAYMWKLCRLISEHPDVEASDMEVYQDAILNAGCNNWFDGSIPKEQFKDFERTITYDHDGWKVAHYAESKEGMVWYRVYYGSSAFTREQMNKLVDYVVREAESYDIPTLESEKIERMLSEWRN